MRRYDAIVVGAGPAGLAAAAELAARGKSCLVVDLGAHHKLRDRSQPNQLLSGIGGAGLFSDGKYSFYPSATKLWQLPDQVRLRHAYEQVAGLFGRHELAIPTFPEYVQPNDEASRSGWHQKHYPSLYVSFADRMRFIDDLVAQGHEPPLLNSCVVGATRTGDLIELEVSQSTGRIVLQAAQLVIATGRLSPLWLRGWLKPLGIRFGFRRIEVGVRIETLARSHLFNELRGVDAKLLWNDAKASFLTFCTCRNGEVVVGKIFNMHSVSGRADGLATEKSNIGLLVRVTDSQLARDLENHTLKVPATFCLPLTAVVTAGATLPALQAAFGPVGAKLVIQGLTRFIEKFGSLADDTQALLYGPCIEGVGDYPISNDNLELAPGVTIAGDACGRFRGIVASMVSGYYVGTSIGR